jgi:hypothetical protein
VRGDQRLQETAAPRRRVELDVGHAVEFGATEQTRLGAASGRVVHRHRRGLEHRRQVIERGDRIAAKRVGAARLIGARGQHAREHLVVGPHHGLGVVEVGQRHVDHAIDEDRTGVRGERGRVRLRELGAVRQPVQRQRRLVDGGAEGVEVGDRLGGGQVRQARIVVHLGDARRAEGRRARRDLVDRRRRGRAPAVVEVRGGGGRAVEIARGEEPAQVEEHQVEAGRDRWIDIGVVVGPRDARVARAALRGHQQADSVPRVGPTPAAPRTPPSWIRRRDRPDRGARRWRRTGGRAARRTGRRLAPAGAR